MEIIVTVMMPGTDLMSCSISGVSGGLAMKTRPLLTPLLLSLSTHFFNKECTDICTTTTTTPTFFSSSSKHLTSVCSLVRMLEMLVSELEMERGKNNHVWAPTDLGLSSQRLLRFQVLQDSKKYYVLKYSQYCEIFKNVCPVQWKRSNRLKSF